MDKKKTTAVSVVPTPQPPAFQTASAEVLISQAIEKNVPVETMERLLAMRTQLKAEAAKEAYNTAMSAFQSECPTIVKSSSVKGKDGKDRYKFAPLDAILKTVKPLLKTHGFSYSVDTIVEENWVTVMCKTTHSDGHSEVSQFKVPVDKDGYMSQPQKFASALTFAKRYAFCNAFGILTGEEDDDALATAEMPVKPPAPPKLARAQEVPAAISGRKEGEANDRLLGLLDAYGMPVAIFEKSVNKKISELSDELATKYGEEFDKRLTEGKRYSPPAPPLAPVAAVALAGVTYLDMARACTNAEQAAALLTRMEEEGASQLKLSSIKSILKAHMTATV